jgi:hypothetical protein
VGSGASSGVAEDWRVEDVAERDNDPTDNKGRELDSTDASVVVVDILAVLDVTGDIVTAGVVVVLAETRSMVALAVEALTKVVVSDAGTSGKVVLNGCEEARSVVISNSVPDCGVGSAGVTEARTPAPSLMLISKPIENSSVSIRVVL